MGSYFLKLLFLLLPFVCGENIYGQQFKNDISSQDYYDFFNSFINPDSVHQFNLESKPDFSYILKDTSSIYKDTTLFSSEDIRFIKFQIKAGQHFRWKSNKILGAKVISSKKIEKFFKNGVDEGWAEFNKKYKNGFASFSVPLFSIDKNICIIYKAGRCGGFCGHGGTSVYKKVNGEWTFVKAIGMIWIS